MAESGIRIPLPDGTSLKLKSLSEDFGLSLDDRHTDSDDGETNGAGLGSDYEREYLLRIERASSSLPTGVCIACGGLIRG